MATSDTPPEGGFPVPTTYPNPLANNVNMRAYPWVAFTDGATPNPNVVAQDAPVRINGAGGSAFSGS